MEIVGKTPVPPVLFITGKTSGYLTWVALAVEMWHPDLLPGSAVPLLKIVALVFLAAGILFIILSSVILGKNVRLGLPVAMTELKTSGIYRISRNPMYAGLHLVTLAAMLYTLNGIVILAGLYSLVVYHFIILGEERFLEERFGARYKVYCGKVRRYLGLKGKGMLF